MIKKFFWFFLVLFAFCYSDVYASSIEYNVTIDKNFYFHETVKYIVNKSEIDTSSYNYPTSVVNDTIYFNNDRTVKYTKTKKTSGSQYIVILKHDYSSMFLNGQRMLNECFSHHNIDFSETKISLETDSPFYCSNRADKIVVKVKTDLDVVSSNADSSSGNVYVWNVDGRAFDIDLSLKIPELSDDEVSSHATDFVSPEEENSNSDVVNDDNSGSSNGDVNSENNDEDISDDTLDESSNNSDSDSGGIFGTVIVIFILLVVLTLVAIFGFVLIKRKNDLNKL